MPLLPRDQRAPAHGPPPGQRQHQQLRHVVRLEIRRQAANQVEQRLEFLNFLIERLIEFVGLGVGAGVFDAAGRNAEQRAEKLYLLVADVSRSEEYTSELQSLRHLVCRLLLEKKKKSI